MQYNKKKIMKSDEFDQFKHNKNTLIKFYKLKKIKMILESISILFNEMIYLTRSIFPISQAICKIV